MELVSVIVPCYNSGRTIEKTIDSIKNQTWKNLEIIVIDDGSTDKFTIKTLSNISDVRLYRQKNKGLSSARNFGIKKAKGKLILPIDSDDWIDKDAIRIMVENLRKNKKISFVFFDQILEGENIGIKKSYYNFFDQLFLNNIPYCIMYKKKMWSFIDGYDEDFKEGFEDWEFNIRLGSEGFYGKRIPLSMFYYNVSSTGMLHSISKKKHSQIWSKIQKKHKKLYSLKNIFNTWLYWKSNKSNHTILVYLILFIMHRTFHALIFNYIFNIIYKLKKYKFGL